MSGFANPSGQHMPDNSPLDLLAEELGAVAGRIEREASLRIQAAISEIRRIDAERELRLTALERRIGDSLAAVKDGAPGASVTAEDVAPLITSEVQRLFSGIAIPKDGENGKDADPEVIRQMVTEALSGLPAAADGKDADPIVIKRMVDEAVSCIELPPAKEPDAAVIEQMVKDKVSSAVESLPRPAPGKDADPEVIRAMVFEEVAKIERPKDGEPGRGVTIEEVAPLLLAELPTIVAAEVEKAAALIPAGKDGEAGKSLTAEDIRPLIQELVEALPKPADGQDGKDADLALIGRMVDEVVAKLPPPENGKDADPAIVKQLVNEAVAGLPPAKDGERGKEGPPGKLPVVKEWTDRVHYEGEVVTCNGSTFQALKDTGRDTSHEDWSCIAAAGSNGKDGRAFTIRGTHAAEEKYASLDVVALNGAAFVAKRDDPGPCPGDGWQLMASQGKQGKPGERGAAVKGDRGPPGPPVIEMSIDGNGAVSLTNGDGSVITCDLYPVLAKLG